MRSETKCLGIDGCKDGWICAVLLGGALDVYRYENVSEILSAHGDFGACLIDIPIGLRSRADQTRPDDCARRYIKGRGSTIFPVPCRQAVELLSASYREACDENARVLNKRFSRQSFGIIPKIREVDDFFKQNPRYISRLMESHPEICFKQLGGKILLSKKNGPEGLAERLAVLGRHGLSITPDEIYNLSKKLQCAPDDIADACCLAVSASYVARGSFITLPETPEYDDAGIPMRMVLPLLPDSEKT